MSQEELQASAQEAIQGLHWSIAARDWSRGVKYYCRVVADIHALKHHFTTKELRNLVELLWSVAVDPEGPNVNIRRKVVDLLSTLLRRKVKELQVDGLVLPWRPLYEIVDKIFFDPTPALVDFNGPNPSTNLKKSYVSLVDRTRRLFPKESAAEVFEEVEKLVCVHSNEIFRAQFILDSFLNADSDPKWLSKVVERWRLVPNSNAWNAIHFRLLARTAKAHLGSLFPFWKVNSPEIFSSILQTMGLALGNSQLVSLPTAEFPKSLQPYIASLSYARGMQFAAKWIVFALDNDTAADSVFARLEHLIQQVKTFFHPSNSGSWSVNLGVFLSSLTTDLAKRINKERKEGSKESNFRFTEKRVHDLLELLLPIALNTVFAKNQMLSKLDPEYVFSKIIDRVYFGLTTATSSHQITNVLELVSSLIDPAISTNIFAQHFAQLLLQSLPAIDLNDSKKTYNTMKFYLALYAKSLPSQFCDRHCEIIVAILSLAHAPLFETIAQGSGETVANRNQAVAMFADWATLFFDRIFEFHREKSKSAQFNWEQVMFDSVFKRVFRLIFMQSSPQLHERLTKKLVDFVKSNIISNSKKEFGQLIDFAVWANPQSGLKIVFGSLFDVVMGKNKTLKSSDPKNIWCLHMLSKAVRHTGVSILPYLSQVHDLVLASLEEPNNKENQKEVSCAGLKLLRGALKALTQKYPVDYRSLNSAEWKEMTANKNHVSKWATFSKKGFEMGWHIPNADEIAQAKAIVQTLASKAFQILDDIIPQVEKKTDFSNSKLSLSLRVLRSILYGAGNLLTDSTEEVALSLSSSVEEMEQKAERDGLYPLKALLKFSEAIPLAQRDSSFRPKVGEYSHSLSKLFLRDLNEQHFLTPMKHLAQLLSALLTVRDVRAGKAEPKQRGYKVFRNFHKNMFRSEAKVPRYILVEKEYALSLKRAESSLFGQAFNVTAKAALTDLIALYSIHSEALTNFRGGISMAFKMIPLAPHHFIPDLTQALSNKDKSESEMLGVLSLLSSPFLLHKIGKNWNTLSSFIESLLASNVHEKPKIQSKIFSLFSDVISHFVVEPLEQKPSSIAVSAFPKGTDFGVIQSIGEYHKRRGQASFLALDELLATMTSFIDTPQSHWRYDLMAVGLFAILYLQNPNKMAHRHAASLKSLTKLLARAELPIVRTLVVHLIQSLLWVMRHQAVPQPLSVDVERSQFDPFTWASAPDILNSASNDTAWNQFLFVEKMHIGWSEEVHKMKVFRLDESSTQLHQALFDDLFVSADGGKSVLEQMVKKMESDHNFTDEDNKDRNERRLEQMVAAIAKNMNINTEAMAGQLGRNGENKDVMNSLLRSVRDFTHSRYGPMIEKDSGFNASNAGLFYEFATVLRDGFVSKSVPLLLTMIQNDERATQCTSFELLGGIVKALNHFSAQQFRDAVKALLPVLALLRDFTLNKLAILDASSMLRWALTNRDPRRYTFLLDLLLPSTQFPGALAEGRSHQLQAQNLSLLAALLETVSWRAPAFNERVRLYVSDKLSHESKQVREAIATVLKAIFSNSFHPSSDKSKTGFLSELMRLVPVDASASQHVELVQTVLFFASFAVEDTAAVAPHLKDVLPTAFALQVSNNEEIRNMSKMLVTLASQVVLPADEFAVIVAQVLPKVAKESDSWRVKGPMSPLIQIMAFNHSFKFSRSSLAALNALVLELLFDEAREVNNAAKKALSSLTKISSEATNELIDKFSKLLATPLPKKKAASPQDTEEATKARARGALGLSALCEAHPYDVPSWMPSVLEELTRHLRDPKPVDVVAQESLKEFWRTHQDEWQFFSAQFTYEQQEAIKQSSLPSYFA